VLALALAAGSASTPFAAVPASHPFRVTVSLNMPAEVQAQCGTITEPGSGRKITVSCATPSAPREPPRYLLHVYRAGEWIPVEGEMGTGTLTSWRIVHVADREYLELLVGW